MTLARILGLSSLLPLASVALVSPVSGDDAPPPSCFTTAADVDGDGFGWQSYATCVVDSTTRDKPVLTHLATGSEVTLIRPYWNANRDIANREIECLRFAFDSVTQVYVQEQPLPLLTFEHAPLPFSEPYIGEMLQPARLFYREVEAWTVSDGLYNGPMELSRADWIEQIGDANLPGASVRYWQNQLRNDGQSDSYIDCRDLSGAGFGPTGFPDESLPVDNRQPAVLNLTAAPYRDRVEPVIDRRTGNQVSLEPKVWDMHNELVGHEWYCQLYEWDESQATYNDWNVGYDNYRYYFHPLPPDSPARGKIYALFDIGTVVRYGEWQRQGDTFVSTPLSDGLELVFHQNVEIVDPSQITSERFSSSRVVRSWLSSDEYYECSLSGKIVGLTGNSFLVRTVENSAQDDLDNSTGEGGDTQTPVTDPTGKPMLNNRQVAVE
jgi:hypothetical protein